MRDERPQSNLPGSRPVPDGTPERPTLGSRHFTRVHLFLADDSLRRALGVLIRAVPGFELESRADGWPDADELVIATTNDLPPERVRSFTAANVYVVVLTPVARSRERQRYESAGVAAYLPMTADGHLLLDELRGIPAHDSHLPGVEPRPVRHAAC